MPPGTGDDEAGIALQQLLRALGAEFLIDLVENVDHVVSHSYAC